MHRNGHGGRILAPGAEPALTAFEINVLMGPRPASNVKSAARLFPSSDGKVRPPGVIVKNRCPTLSYDAYA